MKAKQKKMIAPQSTSSEKNILRFQFEVLKSYLYLVSEKRIRTDRLSVISLYALESAHSPRPKKIVVSDGLAGKFFQLTDAIVVALVEFHGAPYHISLFSQTTRFGSVEFFIHILGQTGGAGDSGKLVDYLMSESIAHSPHRNRTLLATSERNEDEILDLHDMDLREDRLEDIFLPKSTLRQVQLFAQAVAHYETHRQTVRLLFSGKPGTGKTKIIRAIAGLCRGKATFIFSNGSEDKIGELFQIAALFSPVVVCIDDLDMVTGDRQEGIYSKRLATVLQYLDGFSNCDFFVLATTNDKTLVDVAASRPGRFDSVVDISVIAAEHYPALIRSKTRNRRVLDLLDEGVIGRLRGIQATGAFVANLVKHLELIAAFDSSRLSREYVISSIAEAERGFSQNSREERIGFRTA